MREANQDKSVRETLVALRARQDESSYAPLVVLAFSSEARPRNDAERDRAGTDCTPVLLPVFEYYSTC